MGTWNNSKQVFEPSELDLEVRGLSGTIKFPKFVLWLIHDPKWGLLQNTHDVESFDSIKSSVPLYEEWLSTGIKPSIMDDWKRELINNRFSIKNINDGLRYAIPSYVSRYAVRIKVGKNNLNSANDRVCAINAQLNKIKELHEDDGLFSWTDYEKN